MGLHKVALFRFSIVTIFISVFALVALCIGVFSPAWIVLKRNGVWISEGPWYTMACPDGEGHCILSTREMIYGIHSDGRGDSRKNIVKEISKIVERKNAIVFLIYVVKQENHCTRLAQSSRGGCSGQVHKIVYLAIRKGNILVKFCLWSGNRKKNSSLM